MKIANGPIGRAATLLEVGFTRSGTYIVGRIPGQHPPGAPEEAVGYASWPITDEPRRIAQGEHLPFRLGLGRLPDDWDADTEIYPYAYFDEGHWLVGEPSPLVRLLHAAGWRPDPEAPLIVASMYIDYVWPEEQSGLRSRFDLTQGFPLDDPPETPAGR